MKQKESVLKEMEEIISETKIIQEFHNDYPKFPINNDFYKLLITNGIIN